MLTRDYGTPDEMSELREEIERLEAKLRHLEERNRITEGNNASLVELLEAKGGKLQETQDKLNQIKVLMRDWDRLITEEYNDSYDSGLSGGIAFCINALEKVLSSKE